MNINNIYTSNCTDCNEILAYGLQPFKEESSRCFTCMCTFTELAMLLHAENLPDIYDVYTTSHEGSQDAQAIRIKSMKVIKHLKG